MFCISLHQLHIVTLKESFNGNVTLALQDREGLAALGFLIEVSGHRKKKANSRFLYISPPSTPQKDEEKLGAQEIPPSKFSLAVLLVCRRWMRLIRQTAGTT